MPGTLVVLKFFLGLVSFKVILTGPVGTATTGVTLGGGMGGWLEANGVATRGAMTGSADFTTVDAAEMVGLGFGVFSFGGVGVVVVAVVVGAAEIGGITGG